MKKALFSALWLASAFYAQAQTATVQIIHNCADRAADTVDIWLGSTLLVDNMPFRTATAFLPNVPAGQIINIGIAPAYSVDSTEAFRQFALSLSASETYVLVANGIVSNSGYSPRPLLDLSVYAGAKQTATNSTDTEILFHHGSTDATAVSLSESTNGALFSNVSYGQFAGYNTIVSDDYTVQLSDASNSAVLLNRQLPINSNNWAGLAMTVLASGFYNPAINSNGAGLGLWAATPLGGNLIELPPLVAVERNIPFSNLQLYPNPASDLVNISFESKNAETSLQIIDAVGRLVHTQQLGQMDGQQNVQISVADLPAGLYQLTLRSNSAVSSQRLIIQK